MAAELRRARVKAGLTQDAVAQRLGFASAFGQSYVSRLERGAIGRPYLDTIVSYLHVCGVRMSEFSALLDRVESLPPPVVAADTGLQPARVKELEQKVRREVADYQRKAQYPIQALPAPPEKQRRGAEKLQEYRIQASIVEQALKNYLSNALHSTMYYVNYLRIGLQILGALRKYKPPRQREKTEEILARAEASGLDARILAEVSRITTDQHRAVIVATPAGAAPAKVERRAELEQELFAVRQKVYAEIGAEIGSNPEAMKFQRYGNYLFLANRMLKKWFQLRCCGVPGGPGIRRALAPVYDKMVRGDYVRNLKPELVRQVRNIVERNLP
jgi:transcriptional regulator with XRE-family HTH domain